MNIHILASQTLEQAADWCERHRKVLVIKAHLDSHGRVVPWITAVDDTPDDHIPNFLRLQAD